MHTKKEMYLFVLRSVIVSLAKLRLRSPRFTNSLNIVGTFSPIWFFKTFTGNFTHIFIGSNTYLHLKVLCKRRAHYNEWLLCFFH